MDRRTFLALTSTLPVTLALPRAAHAATLDYTEGLVDTLLAEGRTLFVDFAADWCSTCRTQERHITAYRSERPELDRHVTFVRVDWDDFGGSRIVRRLAVPRRSTLVVLRGEAELGRLVAETRPDRIRALMDTALAAATA